MKVNTTSKGYKWIYKNEENKLVKPEIAKTMLLEGWNYGFSKDYRKKLSKSIPHFENQGRAKTKELELLRREKISKSQKGNKNWEHNKSHGSAKQGWYKGIYCDSSWELAFLVYHLEHNLYIQRCIEKREYTYKGEKRTYLPDFITVDGIIEIKGYITEQWKAKLKCNPDIKVIYPKDMKIYLDYTISKYGEKFWELLYEK